MLKEKHTICFHFLTFHVEFCACTDEVAAVCALHCVRNHVSNIDENRFWFADEFENFRIEVWRNVETIGRSPSHLEMFECGH